MKRTVGILSFLFLVLSLGTTVYLVSTNRADIRSKAAPVAAPLATVKSDKAITDWCFLGDDTGPYVNLEVQSGAYDETTGVQVMEVKATRIKNAEGDFKIPLEENLTFWTREEGCVKASVYDSLCGKGDAGYYLETVEHEIPPDKDEASWQMSLSVPPEGRMCGHLRQTVHVWDVGTRREDTSASCNTVVAREDKKTHDVLYVVTQGSACKGNNGSLGQEMGEVVVPPQPVAPLLAQLTNDDFEYKDAREDLVVSGIPRCTGLSASSASGTIPLTVDFIGSGTDLDGEIARFEFIYGDGAVQRIDKKVGSSGNVQMSHTFKNKGEYSALLRVQDNAGSWSTLSDLCRVTIVALDGAPKILGIGAPDESSGSATVTGTPTKTPTVAAGTPTPTVVTPDVPVSGSIMPTLMIGLAGLLILGFGLVFTL